MKLDSNVVAYLRWNSSRLRLANVTSNARPGCTRSRAQVNKYLCDTACLLAQHKQLTVI